MKRTEFKNGNKIARILTRNNSSSFEVYIVQICNTGLEIVEDFFDAKLDISSYTRAEKWALKRIGLQF